jgi:hypothetical protein
MKTSKTEIVKTSVKEVTDVASKLTVGDTVVNMLIESDHVVDRKVRNKLSYVRDSLRVSAGVGASQGLNLQEKITDVLSHDKFKKLIEDIKVPESNE